MNHIISILILVQTMLCLGILESHAGVPPCQFDEDIPKTRPIPEEGGPTQIQVGFYIFDLVDISTVKQEFIMDFYLEAEWQDSRLGEIVRQSEQAACEIAMDLIWRPNMFFD